MSADSFHKKIADLVVKKIIKRVRGAVHADDLLAVEPGLRAALQL